MFAQIFNEQGIVVMTNIYQWIITVVLLSMLPTISSADTIKVGFGYSKPPFVFATSLEDSAKPHGIEVEVMREAFALRGHTITVSYFPNTDLQEQLRKGNIDVATTIPYGQDSSFYYSDEVIYFWNYAITQPEDPRFIRSIGDLKGRKVTAWLGAENDLGQDFQEVVPKMELYREVESQEEQVLLFLQKKLDTIVIDWNIFSFWAYHHGYDPTKYHQNDIFEGRTWFSAAFSEQGLRDDFQQGFNQLKLDGTYDEIYGQLWTSFREESTNRKQAIDLTQAEKAWLKNNPTINIGIDRNYPPFEFVGSRGQFVGISADYLALINTKLGTKFKAQINLSWSEVLEKARRGEIDVIPTIANTKARSDYLNFTAPHIHFPMVILSRKDQEPIANLIDIYGSKLAVVTDFFYVDEIKKDHPEIEFHFVDSPLAALQSVAEGTADAAIVNFAVANHLMVKHGFGTLRADKTTEIKSSEFGYAVRKGLPELVSILDKTLASITREEHQNIRDRWIANLSENFKKISKADLSEQEKKWLSENPIVRVAGDIQWPPFNFSENGNLKGYSIDYMDILAEKTGLKIEYVIGPTWNEFLGKMKDGSLDIMPDIVRTPEREKYLNFTKPYAENPNTILSKSNKKFTSLDSLLGKTVAVTKGFFYEELLKESYPSISVLALQDTEATVKAVSFGEADAALGEYAVFNYIVASKFMTDVAISGEIQIGDKEFNFLNLATRKDQPELRSILQKGMALIGEQEIGAIKNKWFLSQTLVADNDISGQSLDEDVVYLILVCAAFVVISVLFSLYLLPRNLTNEQLAKFVSSKSFTHVIMLLTGVILIIIFSLVWYTLEQGRQSLAKNVKEDLSFVLKGTSERFDFWINDRKQNLSELAAHPELIKLTKQIMIVPSNNEALIRSELQRKIRDLIHSYGGKYEEKGFFIISPDRTTIASSDDKNIGGRNLIDRFAQQRLDSVFSGNSEFIPPIDFGMGSEGFETAQPILHQFSMFFAAPIKDETGKVVAVLTQRLQAGGRISQIMNQGRLGSSGESYLINTEGEMLTTSRFSDQLVDIGLLKKSTKENGLVQLKDPGGNLLSGHNITKDLSELPYTYMADNLLKLSKKPVAYSESTFSKMGSNIVGYRDYRGVNVLGVWQWSYEHGVGITTEIDKVEALESYYQLRFYLMLIAVVSLLLILVSVILTLTIGQRATSFVRRSNEELEILVKERTLRLRSIIENAADGIIVMSNKGVVQNFSPAAEEIFGYSSAEVEGQNIKMLMPEPVRGNHDGYLEHYLEHRKKSVIGNKREVVGLRKNGECFMMDLAVNELYIGSEHLYTGIVRDITDRKHVEEELRQAKEEAESATQAKSDFLANMSHEIRTPMNAIIGMSYLALQTELDRKQRGYVHKVNRSAESLLGIINDILDFSKIEAGKMDMEKIDFRLEDVFDNLANLVGLRAEEKSLEVMFDIPADIPMALIGDPLRLGQVLINLGNNAIKFTAQGEVVFKVAIHELSEKSVKLHFSIRDSGIGMTQEQQAKLFQSFSQADASTTRKFGGTGLGLIISKNLIEMMQGDIWVDSEEGVGSTFHFTANLDIQQGVISDRLCAKKELGPLKVLVVDDNLSAREIFYNMLISFGFIVDQAGGGEAALAQIKEADDTQPYDLVVMDWKMPGMDGIETTRAIQNSAEVSRAPTVIMITAYDREEARTLSSGTDIRGFLTKPVTASSLFNTIMQARGVKSSIDEGYDRHEEMTDLLDKLRGAKVLLVEDNELNQELALELLFRNGIVATLAENGEQALEALEDNEFDGVLMDCQMPVMDGYEATRRIRLSSELENLPIIAMTANAMSGDRDKVLDAGMNDHISKPINVKNMFQTMAKWITPSEPQLSVMKQTEDSVPADIPDIPGIDQNVGLSITQGDKGLYRKLLLKYLNGNKTFVSEFKVAQQNSEQETQVRLAHTLKGTSGNIGAAQIQDIAGQLETACENDQQDLVNELMGSLTAKLEPILVGLSALNDRPDSNATDKVVEPEKVDELLSQLRDLLEDDDTDAADIIDELEKLPSGTLDHVLLKNLAKSVDEYDFETALNVLSDLIKNTRQ